MTFVPSILACSKRAASILLSLQTIGLVLQARLIMYCTAVPIASGTRIQQYPIGAAAATEMERVATEVNAHPRGKKLSHDHY